MKEFFENVYKYLTDNAKTIITLLCVIVFGYIIIKIFLCILKKTFKKKKVDTAASDFIVSLFKISLFIIYFISVFALLGVPTTSMIAVLSAAGLAVSLALQGSLSNLASGIIIIFTKPFSAGDYIDIGSQGGTVEHITIFNTCLMTPDSKQVYIPNSLVTSSNIVNYSKSPTRRIDIELPVAYGSDIEKAKNVLLKTALDTPRVLTVPAPSVHLKGMNNGALVLFVRVWVNNADYWDALFDLTEKSVQTLADEGFEIPFNRYDILINSKNSTLPVQENDGKM